MRILTIFGIVFMSMGVMGDKCPDEKQPVDASAAAEEPKAPVEIIEVPVDGGAATEPAAKPAEPAKVEVGPVTAKEVLPASEVKTEEVKKAEPAKKEEKPKKEEKKEEKPK